MRVLWKSRLFRVPRRWYFDFDSSHTVSQYSNLLLKTIATFSLTFAVTVLATSVFSPVTTLNATDVTISAVNFRILKGHWRTKDEHGVGTESNHWLYDDKPIQSIFIQLTYN